MEFVWPDRVLIDKKSPVPLFFQIAEKIKKMIMEGKIKPGDKLPPEEELCRIFDVSRTTIRNAMNQLVIEGILIRKKGKGTFVAKPKLDLTFANKFIGFGEDLLKRGVKLDNIVLSKRIISAPEQIAERLHIRAGDRVFYLKRLRKVEENPILIVKSYLPYELYPGIEKVDFSKELLYPTLRKKYGITISCVKRTFEPIVLGEYEAKLLEVQPHIPAFFVKSVSFTEEGYPVEYYEAVIRGDMGKITLVIGRCMNSQNV
ncbi:MAG: GntR family transcriptional regulator [Thermotogaceae bacterium]|nr:GntR family transcriptional regulator [Thermotogaceae bacterium]